VGPTPGTDVDTPERRQLREAVRDFAKREIVPNVAAYDREERFPAEIVRKAAKLGWLGAPLSREYGGEELDWLSFAMLIEEISRACHVVGLAISFPSGLVGAGIDKFGTEEQKQQWLAPLIRGDSFAGAGITEPGGGTDVAATRTTYKSTESGYSISGAKAWTSMLDVGDWFLVLASRDRELGRGGLSAFVVPRDSAGLELSPYKNKLGFRPVATGDLTLDEVEVPFENRIGEIDNGYAVAMAAVETGRLSVAARALGLAQACLDASTSYAGSRMVMGQEIGRFQLVQSMITDMVVGIESGREFLYRLAREKDAGVERPRRSASLTKLHCTDVAMASSMAAVQIHGAYGVSEEYPVGRYFRDAKVFQIIEGNNQLHRAMVAEYALGFRGQDR